MKINFDYYTADLAAAIEAYTAAIKVVCNDDRINLHYDEDDDYHNLCGAVDHRNMTELYNILEKHNFADCYSKIDR